MISPRTVALHSGLSQTRCPSFTSAPKPDVDEAQLGPLGFGWQLAAEDLGEKWVHDGVKAFLSKPVPVILRLPDVDVAQAALWPLDRDVADQALWCLVAEALLDAPVER